MIKLILRVESSRGLVTVEKFTQGVIKVGALSSSHLLLDDGSVSRMHCVIETGPNGVQVIDLGSSSGTWVNGEKVIKATLKKDDAITLGNYRIVVDLIKPIEDPDKNMKKVPTAEDNQAHKGFLEMDKTMAFKIVIHRISEDPGFRLMIETLIGSLGRAKDGSPPKSDASDFMEDIDDHVETFATLCAVVESVQGKFDVSRAVKAFDALYGDLSPAVDLAKRHMSEFRGVFDNHLKHSCLLRAELVADMVKKGVTEDHAMVILNATWEGFAKGIVDNLKQTMENKKA